MLKFNDLKPGEKFFRRREIESILVQSELTPAAEEFVKLDDPGSWTHCGDFNAVSVDNGRPACFDKYTDVVIIRHSR